MKIIKIFKLKIYIILILLTTYKKYTKDILYYIYLFIYLITFIVKKLSKKRIEENMKHKEKDGKKNWNRQNGFIV